MGSKIDGDLGEIIARAICWVLRGVAWLVRFRSKSKAWGWLPSTVLAFFVGLVFLWALSGHHFNFEWLKVSDAGWGVFWKKAIVAIFVGFIVHVVILRGVGIVAAVGGQTQEFRKIGLVEVIAATEEYSKVVAKYRAEHQKGTKIRVICMAGRWVFRNKEAPLHADMLNGDLHVILPNPDANGVSFRIRHDSAPEDQKQDSSPSHLAGMTKATAHELDRYNCKLAYHNQLCIWRIVIFSGYCVVQAYLPNKGEKMHMDEPIMVFSKERDQSMYHTFSSMFDALCVMHTQV